MPRKRSTPPSSATEASASPDARAALLEERDPREHDPTFASVFGEEMGADDSDGDDDDDANTQNARASRRSGPIADESGAETVDDDPLASARVRVPDRRAPLRDPELEAQRADHVQPTVPMRVRPNVERLQPETLAPQLSQLDTLSRALGGSVYRASAVFDWCRQNDGRRHRFTRFYFEQRVRVLVDIFPAATERVRAEVEQKRAQIEIYNEFRRATPEDRVQPAFDLLRRCFTVADVAQQSPVPLEPIGYLPVIRGAHIDENAIDAARDGVALELIEALPHGVALT